MTAAVITLFIAIATFILQEGLTNIIHGLIFRFHSNIKLGDRIEVFVDDQAFTGTIAKMTIRHIVMKDIRTNAEIIVPNCKIDSSVIKNAYNKQDCNKYIVAIPISYADAEVQEKSELIKQIIQNAIRSCEWTIVKENVPIYINYNDSSVNYTFYVTTGTIEENFKACSWIKEHVMQQLALEDIHIPFNVLDVNLTEVKTQ